MPAGGRLTIETAPATVALENDERRHHLPPGEYVRLSVTDTGAGMDEATQAHLFEPFFTTKEVGKGTGQGLALAHAAIVKRHGGKLWFESETGKGTTFIIQLPLTALEEKR